MADRSITDHVFEKLMEAIAPRSLSAADRRRLRSRTLERARSSVPADMITLRAADGPWEPLATGVTRKLLQFDRAAGTETFLMHMDAGSQVDGHAHAQREECFVISGEVWIGNHRLAAGDTHVAYPGSQHEPARSTMGALLLIRTGVAAPA